MTESLECIIYVRLTDVERQAVDAFADSQDTPLTRSAVVRAAVVKWLVESGKLPSDYRQDRRMKHQVRAGRETVFNMT